MEDDDDLEAFREYVKQLRPIQGIRSQDNKSPLYRERRAVEELGDVREILTNAGFRIEGLRTIDADPPDCEGFIDGEWSGIEVREFIAEVTIKSYKSGGGVKHVEWTKETFLAELDRLIRRKDQAQSKSGPYKRYFLVIPTNEMHLGTLELSEWLPGAVFHTKLITDAYIGLPYPSNPAAFKIEIKCGDVP